MKVVYRNNRFLLPGIFDISPESADFYSIPKFKLSVNSPYVCFYDIS